MTKIEKNAGHQTRNLVRGRKWKGRYPEKWFDGNVWEIWRGVDFEDETPTVISYLRVTAKRLGKKVVARSMGRAIRFQVIGSDEVQVHKDSICVMGGCWCNQGNPLPEKKS